LDVFLDIPDCAIQDSKNFTLNILIRAISWTLQLWQAKELNLKPRCH